MSGFLKAFEPSVLIEKSFLRSALLVVFLMLATLWSTYLAALQITNANAQRFELMQEKLVGSIAHSLQTSEQILQGARALFFSSDLVEKTEWQSYYDSLHLKENFRGLQGIGYAQWIPNGDIAAFRTSLKRMGIAPMSVYPSASREPQTAIIYLEPQDERNKKALGYDMWSEASRRAAMDAALKSGETQLSGKVRLVQEIDSDVQAGFLLYLPFYGKANRPQSEAERKADIKGFIYAPFRADNFVHAALGDEYQDIAITIYDGKETTPDNILYKSELPNLSPSTQISLRQAKKTFSFQGHNWTILFMALPGFSAQQNKFLPLIILTCGGLLSILVFFLSWAMASAKLRAQQLARDSSSMFKFLIQHTPAAVAMFDKDMRYISYSDRWIKDYALEGRNLIGQCHYDVFPEIVELRPDWIEGHKRAMNGAVLFSEKDMLERPDGSVEYLRYEVRPWRDGNGHIGGIVMFTESITDHVRAIEEIRNSAEELERFAFIASHDLKTPLRGIDNLAKWLEEDLGEKAGEDVHEKLKLLRGRVKRMEMLLEDILTYSRINQVDEANERILPSELLNGLIKNVKLPKGFKVDWDPNMPEVDSPPSPLIHIFSNFISNAVKHHDKKKGNIEISAKTKKGYVVFTVRDDGPGIEEQYHQRIFEMFQTLKSRDITEGSGLGLAIVKKLVESQGGSVTVHSPAIDGRGTEFSFSWPRVYKRESYKK